MVQPLYPTTPQFDAEQFRHPPLDMRGAPFWSWNGTLDLDTLRVQIDAFATMGMGGYHMHVRTGLATPYLGEEFLQAVAFCVQAAAQRGMRAWLYDEDRYPSGAAGGLVTQDPTLRACQLVVTPFPVDAASLQADERQETSAASIPAAPRRMLVRYHILLDEQGYLLQHRRLAADDSPPNTGAIWYGYLATALPTPKFNNQTYLDTLNPQAVRRFIEITHERYAATVGAAFGTTIPAMFTDEPQFTRQESLAFARMPQQVILPYTADLNQTYQEAYGEDLLDRLPEVIWERADRQPSRTRYRYHDHVCERFTQAFADQVGAWCRAHQLRLTGHMMSEESLASQTSVIGEAMRAYRSFDIPGMDTLVDRHEYTTAKQAQSAKHQYGREAMLSEEYGVTRWGFPFAGHKAQGDWQAALGVTLRVHHLAWMSMAGEAKRDYPAPIGWQSPWWREYPLIEDHFARLNTVLSRGQAVVHIGVIHPIESFWLCYGPYDQTGAEQREREQAFADLTEWLLFGQLDFDFIAESLFATQCAPRRAMPLQVGQAAYDVVLVPGLRTMRATTLERLEAFVAGGGSVIFAGAIPTLVDVTADDRALRLAQRCQCIPFQYHAILAALEPWRELALFSAEGTPTTSVLSQMRVDGADRFVFLTHVASHQHEDARNFTAAGVERGIPQAQLRLKGQWLVDHLETMSGAIHPLATSMVSGWTTLHWDFAENSALLLHLSPGSRDLPSPAPPTLQLRHTLSDPLPMALDEPNVLLLDRAVWRLDDGGWEPEMELLRIDQAIRDRLKLPLRTIVPAQPWTQPNRGQQLAMVELQCSLTTEVALRAPQLALEMTQGASCWLDGRAVPVTPAGYYVDPALPTLPLPDMAIGEHQLRLRFPFSSGTNIEWMYLLGAFGVALKGRHCRIIAPVTELAWGDWTTQGLPFYGGNVQYQATLVSAGEDLLIRIPQSGAVLLRVALDGVDRGPIAFPPYELALGPVAAGTHTLTITAFGHRANAFGPIHNGDPQWFWWGPGAWRTEADAWTDGYVLQPMGILAAPQIIALR